MNIGQFNSLIFNGIQFTDTSEIPFAGSSRVMVLKIVKENQKMKIHRSKLKIKII